MIVQSQFLYIVVFVAHLIKSITGFGAALLSIPILSQEYDFLYLVPLFALFDLYSGTAVLVSSKKKDIAFKDIMFIVLGLIIGTGLGALTLKNFQNSTLKLAFGVLIGLFAVQTIFFKDIYIKKQSKFLVISLEL